MDQTQPQGNAQRSESSPAAYAWHPPATLAGFASRQDWGLVRELIDLFLSDGARQLERLKAAASGGDTGVMARICHSLKGSAQAMEAAPVTELSRAIEESARAGVPRDYPAEVEKLASAFEKVRTAMLAYCGDPGASITQH